MSASCPEPDQLQELLNHSSDPERVEQFEQHLEGCARCSNIVDGLLAGDPVVLALQSQSAQDDTPVPPLSARPDAGCQHFEAALQEVMSRLRGEVPHSATVVAQDTPSSLLRGPSEKIPLEFLAPAQGPDELGRLGDYRILNVLGTGGMGVVFRAEDPKLKRIVALKAMLPALAASPSAKKRFMREAQTAASIKHDHIVTIFQVNEDRGAPYLAMEFLHGEPLDARLKRGELGASAPGLPLAEALRIGEQIAEGLAAAHDEGLIHRDIKPANIWLETRSQASGARGQQEETMDKRQAERLAVSRASAARVKILDFGLARSTSDQAGLTVSGAIVGTPTYMAPEQAQGGAVDHRCDLFSLGCVLYVMTTGQLPFKGNDTLTVLMAIGSSDPTPPHDINPDVPEFLSSLIMRLLAKKPEDRPESAREVASSLRALRSELDEATTRPDRPKQTALKTVGGTPRISSRKRLVVAGTLVALLAAAAAGVSLLRFSTPEGEFQVEVSDDSVAVAIHKQGGLKLIERKSGKELIVQARQKQALPAGEYELVITDPKSGLEITGSPTFTLKGKDSASVRVSFRADIAAKEIAVSPLKLDPAKIPAAERYDWQPKELVAVLGKHGMRMWTPVNSLSFSPDGKLATGSNDTFVRIWDTKTLRQERVLFTTQYTDRLSFARDAKILARAHSTHGPDGIQIWDLSGNEPKLRSLSHPSHGVALSADGKLLASGGVDKLVRLWNLDSDPPKELAILSGHKERVVCVALSADGKTLASASADQTVRLWDIREGKASERGVFTRHKGLVFVAFSVDGKMLVSGESSGLGDALIRFWDLSQPKPQEIAALPAQGQALAFSPDGKTLAACGPWRNEIVLFDLAKPKPKQRSVIANNTGHSTLAFSPDGKTLAAGSVFDACVDLWDMTGNEPRLRTDRSGHLSHIRSLAFAADGKTLVSGSYNALEVWDLGHPVAKKVAQPLTKGHLRSGHIHGINQADLAARDSKLASTSIAQPTCFLWDLTDPARAMPVRLKGQQGANSVAISADGTILATDGDAKKEVRIWDLTGEDTALLDTNEPKRVSTIKLPKGYGTESLVISADGKKLAIFCAGKEWQTQLWDLSGAEPRLRAQLQNTVMLSISPDGKKLVCLGPDNTLQIWDTSGEKLRLLGKLGGYINGPTVGAAVSPDGKTIVVTGRGDGQIRLWDGKTRRWDGQSKKDDLPGWQLPGAVYRAAFSPCGQYLATGNGNGTVYIMRLPSARSKQRP